MTRLLPHPLLSGVLTLLWLLLNQSLTPGQILLGLSAGLEGGWAFAALGAKSSPARRPAMMLRLIGRVAIDIVRSNIAVGFIILGMGRRNRESGFVEIPLELRNRYGLATLACIITSTPGTLWVDLDAASNTLTIHVLDLVDEAEWKRTIKDQYERPLLEIFA